MPRSPFVIRADDVMPFSIPGTEDTYESQCIIDRVGAGSQTLQINRSTLKAHKALGGGTHSPAYDEVYYVLSGRGRVSLGGDPESRVGSEVVELEPESVVFIPGGVFHSVENPYDEDMVFLTIWPKPPVPGENGIYDARLREWGTSFRRRVP